MLANHIKPPLYGNREQIPSNDCKEYYLFLLEFFIKQVSSNRLTKLNQMFFVPTTIYFGFLDFVNDDDLMVTATDQLEASIADDIQIFNTGKSVLFSVDYTAVMDRTVPMILNITVKKQMPNGIKPDVLVGIGELDLTKQYAALRMEMLQCWKKGVMTSKVFDGRVPLIHNGNLSGNLDIFVRISSFGQTIITELDTPPMMGDSSTFVFGTKESDQIFLYKCCKVDSHTIDFFEDSSDHIQSPINCSICVPEKYLCKPCNRPLAIDKNNKKIRNKEDNKKFRSDFQSSKNLIQPSRDSSQPCGKPVILKVSGLFDNGDGVGDKKPTVTVAADSTATKPDDSTELDHDIFVLRIGKKGLVGVGDKSDIQLEMKTPKGPEKRPPVRYETRDMQTDIEEKPLKEIKTKKKKKTNRSH
ncbi:uncharacterized protein [Linepithema humile]|uniref:uncharacterized protein isoform X1 n=1 Tax=Linepithema humile TaxID=83485 RepID=UPI00351E8637